MAHFKKIKVAFDTKLNSLPGSAPIAWENIKYVPNLNELYIRPTFIPAKSSTLILDRTLSESGVYQVDVFGPLNKGMGQVLDKMDDIYNLFIGVDSLVSDDIEIFLGAIGQVKAEIKESWIIGTVEIFYRCYNK